MSNNPISSTEVPRVADLVKRFREIGDTSMRDLPLYNGALEVEVIGFQVLDGHWIGVLITPWFMNLMRLPEQPVAMDMAGIGRKRRLALPTGERVLIQGGDEKIGSYESLSLHSPMFGFQTQNAARQEAELRLEDLMRASEQSIPEDKGRLRADKEQLPVMSRRAFLGGAGSDA